MGEVHKIPSAAEAEHEASLWFARMHADDVTAEDRARFESWRGAHACNAKAYAELSDTWEELVESAPLVRAVNFGQAMNAAATLPAPRRRWVALAAAAVVATLAIGAAWNLFKEKEETGFQTAIGEQAKVALPDGSSFDLNTNSLLRVDYSQRIRVVRLERGEAFFKVAHDTQRPFWVRAGNSWVCAIGTAFNVYVRPTGAAEVTVSEGTVKVVNATSNEPPPANAAAMTAVVASLTAGEQVDVQGGAEVIHELNPAQLSHLLGWRKSTLYFQDQPLGEVVDELTRYTTSRIVIKDEALRQLPVGGTFQANPAGMEALLTLLQDGFGANIQRDGQGHVFIEGTTD